MLELLISKDRQEEITEVKQVEMAEGEEEVETEAEAEAEVEMEAIESL